MFRLFVNLYFYLNRHLLTNNGDARVAFASESIFLPICQMPDGNVCTELWVLRRFLLRGSLGPLFNCLHLSPHGGLLNGTTSLNYKWPYIWGQKDKNSYVD